MLFDILDYRYTNTDLHGKSTEKIMYGMHGTARKDNVRKPRRDTEMQNGVAIPC